MVRPDQTTGGREGRKEHQRQQACGSHVEYDTLGPSGESYPMATTFKVA